MMKKIKCSINIIIVFLILTIALFFIPTNTYARYVEGAIDTTQSSSSDLTSSGVINPGNFEPPALTDEDTKDIMSKGATIVSVIRVIGIIVTVVSLMLMGIKYMTGSIEEKADYKKSMIPYIIGVFIFFALTQLLGVVIKIAEGFNA